MRVPANLPRAGHPCAACGLCCRSYLVPLFGHDLYRLVTRRGLDPRAFAFLCEQERPDAVGFRLVADGPTYGLALDKQHRLQVSEPCTFLVDDGDGTSHCAVYEDRPIACVTYPMARTSSGVGMLPAALCPPDAWGTDETANPEWSLSLRRLARSRDIYVEVVNRWNAWIAAAALPPRPPEHFVAYVLQVYQRLAELDTALGAEALAQVERTWASVARDAPIVGRRDDEPSWIGYLRRARAVIDGYFPDVPPLPFARIATAPTDVEAPPSH